MAEYLLSVHNVEGQAAPTVPEMEKAYQDVDAFNNELRHQCGPTTR